MAETELIKKIKKLKEIKPRKDWVLLTKSQILGSPAQISEKFMAGKEPKFELFPFFRPAYVVAFLFLLLVGLLELSQTSLPGELLYPLKRVVEKSQAVFVSEEEKPKLNLELANKRLEELSKIAETNQVKKLAPALSAFQANVSEAVRNLNATGSDPTTLKKIVEQTQKIKENTEKVETLGVVVGEEAIEELEDTIGMQIVRGIEIWKAQISNLSDEIETKGALGKLLNEAEEYYKSGDYYQASQALEKIYLSFPQP